MHKYAEDSRFTKVIKYPTEESNIDFLTSHVLRMRGFLELIEISIGVSVMLVINIRRQAIMAKVELKKPIIEEISELLNGAASAVIVDYRGLTVEEDTALRKQLREAGVTYKVYKNTMINFAIKGTEFEELGKHLEGPTALAVSKDDATAPARILFKFSQTAKALELKAGVVEGNYFDAAGIQAVADLPSRDELIAKFMGSIQSPVGKLVRTFQAIADAQGAPAAEAAAE